MVQSPVADDTTWPPAMTDDRKMTYRGNTYHLDANNLWLDDENNILDMNQDGSPAVTSDSNELSIVYDSDSQYRAFEESTDEEENEDEASFSL